MSTILRKIVVVIIMFLTFLTTEVFARDFRDTIRLQMPNGATVEYGINYRRLHVYKSSHDELKTQVDLKDELENFLKRWAVLGITDLDEKEPMLIKDSSYRITISERENIATAFFPNDTKTVLTVKGRHQLKLNLEDSAVSIYFDTIEQLEEIAEYDIEKILAGGDAALDPIVSDPERRKYLLEAWLSVDEYEQVGLTYQRTAFINPNRNLLYFSGRPIIENINGDWLAGFGLSLAYIFSDNNGREFFRPKLEYDFMYNFSADKTNIAHWMDAVFSFNISKENPKWAGISFGYLVKQNGDFFDNNKFRLGFPMDVGNYVTISPQFYSKKFFKGNKRDDRYYGVKLLVRW